MASVTTSKLHSLCILPSSRNSCCFLAMLSSFALHVFKYKHLVNTYTLLTMYYHTYFAKAPFDSAADVSCLVPVSIAMLRSVSICVCVCVCV